MDINTPRKDFPILQTMNRGRPLIYLDSAASAQKPRQVIEAMDQSQWNDETMRKYSCGKNDPGKTSDIRLEIYKSLGEAGGILYFFNKDFRYVSGWYDMFTSPIRVF